MSPQQQPLDPEGLEAYFTDVEHLRDVFKNAVAAPTLTKRLLVIHGVGGVGKSSLLRMFRLHCKSVRVPVALASGDEAKSAVDVLSDWTEDLKADGVKLPTFTKTFEHYRVIQSKVEEQTRKAQQATLSKAAKTVVETAASTIPGLGPLVTILGGASAEALADWLRGFLSRPDIDLLLDPAKKLSEDFLNDVARIAPKQRLVLMLDTFEQMTALEDWARNLAQQTHPNVLLVIAGRAMPNWSRQWPGWMAQAQVEELKPMSEDDMRMLVRRYYATMRGSEPDPVQVESIIRFARGLPIVVTSAVRLWVQYGVEDFQAVKPQVVADLVDRLMEGVPKEMAPPLEAAAAVRWFNKEILRAVTGLADVNASYDELRRFPFVRPRVEGLALHDAVREILDENLRVHDPERHRELHERAAVYFEERLAKAAGEEAERLELEQLYHRVRADEEAGVRLFQEMAEELIRFRLLTRLRTLLNDVNSYLVHENGGLYENGGLWREYYNARLAHREHRLADAEAEIVYQAISENEHAEPKLRAYALCSLGKILARWQRLGESSGIEKVAKILEQGLRVVPLDAYLAEMLGTLAHVNRYRGEWDKAIGYNEEAIQFFKEHSDQYGLIDAYINKRVHHASRGEWKEMFDTHKLGMEVLPALANRSYFRARFLAGSAWAWAFAGRYAEAEPNVRKGLSIAEHRDDIWDHSLYLGLLLTRQNRYSEAQKYFCISLKAAHDMGKDYQINVANVHGYRGTLLTRQGKWKKAERNLTKSLTIFEHFRVYPGIPELLVWLGQLHEAKQEWNTALGWYNRCLKMKWVGRHNFECEALVGFCRAKHQLETFADIPQIAADAEQLAQQYEYNDHLASLRLTQGHIAWDGHIPEWGSGLDAALRFYQHALIYALRYNRFLLDEVLWGGNVATPLRPIIPHCTEHGEEGHRMLIALRDWWKTGVNDIGTPRPDTISPIPEGIPLLEAERLARERERGDGLLQQTVVEKIQAALGSGDNK